VNTESGLSMHSAHATHWEVVCGIVYMVVLSMEWDHS